MCLSEERNLLCYLYTCRLLRLRGVIAHTLPNALPEKSMRAIYCTPKICKFPHL